MLISTVSYHASTVSTTLTIAVLLTVGIGFSLWMRNSAFKASGNIIVPPQGGRKTMFVLSCLTVLIAAIHIFNKTQLVHATNLSGLIIAIDVVRQGGDPTLFNDPTQVESPELIMAVRDIIIDDSSFAGIFVEWMTVGDTTLIRGTYFEEKFMLAFGVLFFAFNVISAIFGLFDRSAYQRPALE